MPQNLYLFLRELLDLFRIKLRGQEENTLERVVTTQTSTGGLNGVFELAGYTYQTFQGNLTSPMAATLVVATGSLLTFLLVDKMLERCVGNGSVKGFKERACARGLALLAAMVFAFGYLEIALCCLIHLKSGLPENTIEWVIIGVASAPFFALPFLLGICLHCKVAKARVSLGIDKDKTKKKEKKREKVEKNKDGTIEDRTGEDDKVSEKESSSSEESSQSDQDSFKEF